MPIQRYSIGLSMGLNGKSITVQITDCDGDYVLYADHLVDKEVAVREKEELGTEGSQRYEAFLKEQIVGLRENKLYLENDIALKMEEIAALKTEKNLWELTYRKKEANRLKEG